MTEGILLLLIHEHLQQDLRQRVLQRIIRRRRRSVLQCCRLQAKDTRPRLKATLLANRLRQPGRKYRTA